MICIIFFFSHFLSCLTNFACRTVTELGFRSTENDSTDYLPDDVDDDHDVGNDVSNRLSAISMWLFRTAATNDCKVTHIRGSDNIRQMSRTRKRETRSLLRRFCFRVLLSCIAVHLSSSVWRKCRDSRPQCYKCKVSILSE